MGKKHIILGGLIAVLGLFPQAGGAIPITGDGALGYFSGNLTYSFTSSTTASLVVTLTNTSLVANGGYLTAFVFNNPGNVITGLTLSSTNANFSLSGGTSFTNSINLSPFGHFDIGASTGRGGNPTRGIAVSNTEVFTFLATGTRLGTLNELSFLSALSSNPGGGGAQFFVARFRGFDDGGSDKTPAGALVPESNTLLLFGSGLAGLAGLRLLGRRLRRGRNDH